MAPAPQDGSYERSFPWVSFPFDVVVFFAVDCFYPSFGGWFPPRGAFPFWGFALPYVLNYFLELDALFGFVSFAPVIFTEFTLIRFGIFPQLFGRTDPGINEFGIEALLEYLLP
ncbi:hypothetical protein A2U01_0023599 [Trifolium medium]|uniref:Uncharacterized protein n=1 Tax=Trifolium medium TaxID=97028 RepID=A0A392NTZ5_9FABA|nr:hypothetical protein [Trifolium medium]